MNKRTDAREVAFKLIFEYLFCNQANELSLENLCKEYELSTEQEYTSSVYFGVIKNIDSLNQIIASNAVGFKLDRIFKVDRAIMLVALYEILYMPDIPYLVSINEALNLAKKFSTDKSSSFINGILSKVQKDGNN